VPSPSSEGGGLAAAVGRLAAAIASLEGYDKGALAHLRRPDSPAFEETWLMLAVRVLEPAGELQPDSYGKLVEQAWRALATGIAIAGHGTEAGSSFGKSLAAAMFPLARLRGLVADRELDAARWTFELASFMAGRRVTPDWIGWARLLLWPELRPELITQLRRPTPPPTSCRAD
jgi:hypothetical protein